MTSRPLRLGLVLVALVLDLEAAPLTRHYSSPKQCGFEFDYPGDWVAVPLPDDETAWCRVRLRPNDFAQQMEEYDVDVYTLEVGRAKGEFLEAAAHNFFDFVKGKWVVLGRQGIHGDAEIVVTERWNGLKGVAAVGCYHEGPDGGYAGLCELSRLVLRDEDDNIWAMEGGPQSDKVFDAILASFRFVKE